jgi:hypothetical protein
LGRGGGDNDDDNNAGGLLSLGVGLESDRHRGMHLRMMCLGGIANLLEEEDEEQCNEGGAAGDNNNNDWQGNGSKSFGVGGGGGDDKDGRQRRVEEAYRWARYTSLSHLGNCLRLDPKLCRAMLLMLGGEISVADNDDNDNDDDEDDNEIKKERQLR